MKYQIVYTKALLNFFKHHGSGFGINTLEECLLALEANDKESARSFYKSIKLNGMGSITDFVPTIIHESETDEYNEAVMIALLNEWGRRMEELA